MGLGYIGWRQVRHDADNTPPLSSFEGEMDRANICHQ